MTELSRAKAEQELLKLFNKPTNDAKILLRTIKERLGVVDNFDSLFSLFTFERKRLHHDQFSNISQLYHALAKCLKLDQNTSFENQVIAAIQACPQLSFPLLMMPLRLETRIVESELWIRIYPDQIFVDTHDEKITEDEQDSIIAFKKNNQDEKAAWRRLVSDHGRCRAAYLARLACTLEAEQINSLPTRGQMLEKAPSMSALPNRFQVSIFIDDQLVFKALTKNLRWDNTLANLSQSEGNSLFDGRSRWVQDFSTAEKEGFALRIKIPEISDSDVEKIDQLIVTGIREGTVAEGATEFERLLATHRYTDGAGFVRPNRPTNNTAEHSTEYSKDDDAESSFELDCRPNINQSFDQRVRQRSYAHTLANALGIDVDPFLCLEDALYTGDGLAKEMNQILWSAISDEFFRGMLNKTLLQGQKNNAIRNTNRSIARIQDFFRVSSEHEIRAVGPLFKISEATNSLLVVTTSTQLMLKQWDDFKFKTLGSWANGTEFTDPPKPVYNFLLVKYETTISWKLNTSTDKFIHGGYNKGLRKDIIVVSTPRGIVITYYSWNKKTWELFKFIKNGTRFTASGLGGWTIDTTKDEFETLVGYDVQGRSLQSTSDTANTFVVVKRGSYSSVLDLIREVVRSKPFNTFHEYCHDFFTQKDEPKVLYVLRNNLFESSTTDLKFKEIAIDENTCSLSYFDPSQDKICFVGRFVPTRSTWIKGKHQALVSCKDGIKIFELQKKASDDVTKLVLKRFYPNGVTLCGWELNTELDIYCAAARIDRETHENGFFDTYDEVIVRNDRRIGVIKFFHHMCEDTSVINAGIESFSGSRDRLLQHLSAHAAYFVRGSGFLPSLRIGNQPYGILPVTRVKPALERERHGYSKFLEHSDAVQLPEYSKFYLPSLYSGEQGWQPWKGDANANKEIDILVYDLVYKLYQKFRWLKNSVPVINRSKEAADKDLLEVLSMSPYSVNYQIDSMIPSRKSDEYRAELKDYAVWKSGTGSNSLFEITKSFVNTGRRKDLLLGALNRVKLEWNDDFWNLSTMISTVLDPNETHEFLALKNKTAKEILNRATGNVQENDALIIRLFRQAKNKLGYPRLSRLVQPFSDSTETVDLDRLFRESLDIFSHRLDAWVSSFATKRLKGLRADNRYETGLYLGAYGYVENLPLQSNSEQRSEGYIHAPSTNQATTAAVLYNAFLTHQFEDVGTINSGNPYHLRLSSERVKKALFMADGLRQGQNLAGLLGAEFESQLRRFENARLMHYLDELRVVFPINSTVVSKAEAVPEQTQNTVYALINGLDLLRDLRVYQSKVKGRQKRSSKFYAFFNNFSVNEADIGALISIAEKVDDSLDAMGDLLLFESSHHAVNGNFERSAAVLDAAKGEQIVPDNFESVQTQVSGRSATYRIAFVLDKEIDFSSANDKLFNPLAAIEPALAHFISGLIGSLAKIDVGFGTWLNEKRESPLIDYISIADLKISPSHFFYLAQAPLGDLASELELRLLAAIREKFKFNTDKQVYLLFNHARAEHVSLDKACLLARKIFNLFSQSTALAANDLLSPEDVFTKDPSEQGRADKATFDLLYQRTRNGLAIYLNYMRVLKILSRRRYGSWTYHRYLSMRSQYGIEAEFMSFELTGDFITPIQKTLPTLEKRRKQAKDILDKTLLQSRSPDADYAHLVQQLISVFKLLFGKQVIILPRIKVQANDKLDSAVEQDILNGLGESRLRTWVEQSAEVNKPVRNLVQTLQLGELWQRHIHSDKRPLRLDIMQLPYNEDRQWVGLSDQEKAPENAKATWSLHPYSILTVRANESNKLRSNAYTSGILVGDWTETIPDREIDTSVAFHYNAPTTQAPQACLLAVPPSISSSNGIQFWSPSMLAEIVKDTMDLAKMRAVDTDVIAKSGFGGLREFFPAMYFKNNSSENSWVGKLNKESFKQWLEGNDLDFYSDTSFDNGGLRYYVLEHNVKSTDYSTNFGVFFNDDYYNRWLSVKRKFGEKKAGRMLRDLELSDHRGLGLLSFSISDFGSFFGSIFPRTMEISGIRFESRVGMITHYEHITKKVDSEHSLNDYEYKTQYFGIGIRPIDYSDRSIYLMITLERPAKYVRVYIEKRSNLGSPALEALNRYGRKLADAVFRNDYYEFEASEIRKIRIRGRWRLKRIESVHDIV